MGDAMVAHQFFLILLALIALGNPVSLDIAMGPDDPVSANRDAVCSDLVRLAARAHQYYHRAPALGGGGNSFIGLTADYSGLAKLTNLPGGKNVNGTYRISCAGLGNQVILEGVGREAVAGGNYITMHIIVREQGRPDSLYQVY